MAKRISTAIAVALIALVGVIVAALIGVLPQYCRPQGGSGGPQSTISFGIPEGARLDSARQIVAGKLNVSVVFASSCSEKAKGVKLDGAEITGSRDDPPTLLRSMLARVKDNTVRYEVGEIEGGKRYEIRCF